MSFNVNKLGNNRFLTKDDSGDGLIATIDRITKGNVAPEGEKAEEKWILHFQEDEIKPLVLNVVNGKKIARMFDDETGDTWPGKQIELYNDPDVDFAGKIIGGIRVRQPAPASTSAPAGTDFSDDIPM